MFDSNDIVGLAVRLRRLERKVDRLIEQLGATVEADDDDTPEYPEVVELVRRGKQIEAIKAYRQYTGLGLKEAKDYVDALMYRAKRGEL